MAGSSRRLTIGRALREAVQYEMTNNESVFMMGQDIFSFGGVFGVAEGLGEKFGPQRIVDTPISETGVIGAAAGAAMAGMRPIVEMAYVDFIGVCFNAIANYAAKTHYMSGGQFKVPMVLLASTGGGYSNAAQHSQTLHGTLAHMPGMKVVCPSNAYDAKGMMHTALRGDDFVVYLANIQTIGMMMLGKPLPGTIVDVPKEAYEVPFGKAAVLREGTDVTLVGTASAVHDSLKAAEELEKEHGISAEVIDLRSFVPLDRETIFNSVQKTGHLVVSDEDYHSYGVTGEIVASVAEMDPTVFKKPPQRVAFPDVPSPFSRPMEQFCLPSAARIKQAVLDIT